MSELYENALEDFNTVLDFHERIPLEEKIVGRALWGRAWVYAFQGNVEELANDLRAIISLYKLSERCDCGHEFIPLTYHHKDFVFVLCDDFCERTIDNMSSFMKAMCAIIPKKEAKVVFYLFIDGLSKKAVDCCRAGGFWRECVDPMVKIAEKWKFFGIPADPYWD